MNIQIKQPPSVELDSSIFSRCYDVDTYLRVVKWERFQNHSFTGIDHWLWCDLNGFHRLWSCEKLKKFQKSKKNLDRAHPTPSIFFFWKPITDMDRTLKS